MRERGRITRMLIVLLVIAPWGTFRIWEVAAGQGTVAFQKEKHASITVTDPVYDFGEIIQGEKPVTTFALSNTGDDVLLIDRVAPDKKNIIAEASHELLLPGEEGTIKVTLDSTGLYGNVVGRIAVITNDEKKPRVFLQVMAKVKPILALHPPFIFVGQVTKEGSFSGKAKLLGKLVDEGKLKSITIHTSSPAIEARIRQRGKKKAILEFVLRPEQRAGTFQESITLVSETPPAKAQLRLIGQKLGDIRVTPDRFEFFPKKGVKPDSRSIVLECEKPFNITKVEDLTGLLNLSIETIEKGRRYRLRAKLKNPLQGSFLGAVRVHTDLEVHPLIYVPAIGGGN